MGDFVFGGERLTFDIRLMGKGKGENEEVVPNPLAILGSGYANNTLSFARKYLFTDKRLSVEKARKMGLKFHREFTIWCQKTTGKETFFGSSSNGYYYSGKEFDRDQFDYTVRLLGVYLSAIALECGIKFS